VDLAVGDLAEDPVCLTREKPTRHQRVARASIGNHHRVAAKVVSIIECGRPATSVHGFVLAVFRARAPCSCSVLVLDRSIMRLYHSIPVNALLGQEFSEG
jgi:hypothetical protein